MVLYKRGNVLWKIKEKAKTVQKRVEEIVQKIEVATAAREQATEKLELIL